VLYFKTRKAARIFKMKNEAYIVVDNGSEASHRWGVRVIYSYNV